MGESAFSALTVAVIYVLAASNVDAAGAPCCKAFAFDTNNLLRTSEASLDIAELNFRQLRQVVALLDDVKTLRIQQLHAFEAWRKLCTEQVLGRTGHPGSPGPPGDKGAKGAQGKWGEHGPAGDAGKPGVHGAPGFEGVRGSIGPTGPAGSPGQPGPIIKIKGFAGEVGPPGPPSRKRGPPGTKGYEGPRGKHGDQGEFGPIGPPSFCCQRPSHPKPDEHDPPRRPVASKESEESERPHEVPRKPDDDKDWDGKDRDWPREEHKEPRKQSEEKGDDNGREKRDRPSQRWPGGDKWKNVNKRRDKDCPEDKSDGDKHDWDDDHHHSGHHKNGGWNDKEGNGADWNKKDRLAHDDVNSDEKSAETPLTTPLRTNGSNARRNDKDDGAVLNNAPASLSDRTRGNDDGRRRS